MSNWVDYSVDVLEGSPAEINQIAERLKQPSAELVNLKEQSSPTAREGVQTAEELGRQK